MNLKEVSKEHAKKLLNANGKVLKPDQHETTREIERRKEDNSYLPVIIKRTDEAVRHPDDILERAIHEGLEQHHRSALSLLLSGIAAGLILGFAGMTVSIANEMLLPLDNELISRLGMALVYPLGFIICIMSGTQLFTEHTATAIYPILDNRARYRQLMKLWGVVLTGNILGTFFSSFLISVANPVIQSKQGVIHLYEHLIHFGSMEIFVSAILAGWLMAQGGWLVLATPPASSQVICIYIVTFIIGLGGLHHSIAGSAEIFSGLFQVENPNFYDSFRFLALAILGNLIGGSLFVGVLNYGHIRQTQ